MSALLTAVLQLAFCLGFGMPFASPALAVGDEGAAAWDAIVNFNPVVPGYFADPTLKKFGDTYYLYTSTDGIGACEGWTQVWISKDMVNWVNYKLDWKVFAVKANPGFVIVDVIVDGGSVGAVSTYSLEKIDGSHRIFARFRSENKVVGSVPRPGDLLFSCLAEDLPEAGKIASWKTRIPKDGALAPMSDSTVTRIDGRKFACINAPEGDGFRFGSARSEDLGCNGFTIVAALRHRRHSARDAWDSVVDIFYDRFQLGVYNWNGTVYVRRNGRARTSDFALADGQIAVLSLVVRPDGTWKVFADHREIMASDSADQMTKLVPGVAGGFGRCINLGRNEPDAWSTFNGEIGDVFLYKSALSDSERKELVNFIAAKLVGGGESGAAK